MKNENIKKIEKKLEELAEETKNLGLSSPEEDLPLKIMRLVKKSLDENDLDITITPMMYNPEDFMPILGVLTKEESGALRLKYKISITENKKDIFSDLKKQRKEVLNKWEATGLLDGLEGYKPKENLALLLDGAPRAFLKPSDLLESKASKLLKKEFLNLDELNDYLRMLADMDNIGIRRKLVLLEGFINKIKREINQ